MRQNLDQKMFSKFSEDATAVPTNNISGSKIPGSVEAGDDPPVRRREKIHLSEGCKKTLETRWKKKLRLRKLCHRENCRGK